MKKVIRLTEKDLTRIVKRIIKEESSTSSGLKTCLSKTSSELNVIVYGLFNATNKLNFNLFSNWDEETIADSLVKIKNKQQYTQLNKLLSCAYDTVAMDGLHPAESGSAYGHDFIKNIISVSLTDGWDSKYFWKVMDHFIKYKIFDKTSEYCTDEAFIGSHEPNDIDFYCGVDPLRWSK